MHRKLKKYVCFIIWSEKRNWAKIFILEFWISCLSLTSVGFGSLGTSLSYRPFTKYQLAVCFGEWVMVLCLGYLAPICGSKVMGPMVASLLFTVFFRVNWPRSSSSRLVVQPSILNGFHFKDRFYIWNGFRVNPGRIKGRSTGPTAWSGPAFKTLKQMTRLCTCTRSIFQFFDIWKRWKPGSLCFVCITDAIFWILQVDEQI